MWFVKFYREAFIIFYSCFRQRKAILKVASEISINTNSHALTARLPHQAYVKDTMKVYFC